ncbi:OLC1v1022529C1 [Oldenlandia corymbosa var. corymbosa]|uniref:OLC1v1022529C1 n=1 Tax=Oldenlandia corymbosa var. corymbosa TaxID=529605 RepID=A0AAV1BY18_OLDCO|nr:OLC1v1022529C1 [Oldenlandia corymbosa var. corymbosa]
MDIDLLHFFILFSILLLLKFLGTRFRTENSPSRYNLPPGPCKLPFIGNLHQLYGSPPHVALRDLANKYGPIMHLQFGEVSTVIVSSPEAAKEIMCKLVTSILAQGLQVLRRVQSLRSLREDETSTLMRLMACNAGSPVNLTKNLHSSLYANTSISAFGKISPEQEAFISTVQEAAKLKFHKKLDSILGKIIDEHRTNSAAKIGNPEAHKDLVDVLLQFHEEENLEFSLPTENIKAVLLDISTAESATAAKTIDWAMFEMKKNPRIMGKAQEEVRDVFKGKAQIGEEDFYKLKYLKSVIKETLRLHLPIPLLLPRQSIESCRIKGYDIPAKTKVVLNAWAISKHPSSWKLE